MDVEEKNNLLDQIYKDPKTGPRPRKYKGSFLAIFELTSESTLILSNTFYIIKFSLLI